jgi:hypothetical protein
MKKIWYVKGRYGSGKWFKTEKAFLSHVREDDTREVFVYQLLDSGIAGEVKRSTITERDRKKQSRTSEQSLKRLQKIHQVKDIYYQR